eukprot:TRINITY_DN3396_c0_g1_i1.p1 TRINITY_DN3396_c0_g1~~TRINITY_DN3396_c0_g1_i1.p1  ORF type:complete len:124 (-),score=36.16 TRINITY_DN3396_c0_g1_i1:160-531(-)
MRLLTHNMLCGPKGGFPLRLTVAQVELLSVEYDEDYIKRTLPKLEWNGLLSAIRDLQQQGHLVDLPPLPAEPPALDCSDEELLKRLHHVLNEVKVVEGELRCPDTNQTFAINQGIPKMLFAEK